MTAYSALNAAQLARLEELAGAENFSAAHAERELRSRDAGHHPPQLAECVIWGRDAAQISRVLAYANAQRIPVTAWGVGTGLEGNAIPTRGGILLTMERMTRIVEVHADDFQVTVEAGVPHKDLNAALARYGLFFPPDPGANATIGGMLANNAAGIRTVKYGASKDNVLAAQVVLADGRILQLGSRSVKQSSGYNLLQLFVGSEGTLGIITQATLKLVPVPQHMSAMIASFADVTQAIEAVVAVRGAGLDVAALEFLDVTNTLALNQAGTDIPPYPTLLMEIHAAHAATLDEDIATVRALCAACGALHFRATADAAERKTLWQARHHAYETLVRNHPNERIFIMDVAVPISAFPQLIAHARATIDAAGIRGYMKGHAGDGNIHIELPYATPEGLEVVKGVNGAIVREAIRLGGTATGEHGVGIGKRAYMAQEHGEALVVMRQIKQTLDPNGILNPDKVL